jgi:alditol oxidase
MSVYWEAIGAAVWYVHVRTVKGDDLWLSMANGEGPTVSIALDFKPLPELMDPVLALVEAALLPYGARPHWAKHFLMSPEQFWHRYPRLAEFR